MAQASAASSPLPAVAHLRVYSPLAVVDEPLRTALTRVLVSPAPSVADALRAEQAGALRAQLAGRLPTAPSAVLRLEPEDVPGGAHRVVGPGTVVCPWDSRRRAAAALVGAAQRRPPVLTAAAGLDATAVQAARRVLADGGAGPVHVLSSTWSVPLAWFVLVDPARRQLVDEPGLRRPVWRAAVSDARVRAGRALRAWDGVPGPGAGVAAVLTDVLRWFSRFPEGCAVELDYAGLGARLDDAALAQDTSCAVVEEVVGLLERGRGDLVGPALAPVQDYWSRVRSWEHAN